jgi:hypothetical protein
MPFRRLFAILAMALILTGPAFAADWMVTRLRGAVEILVEGNWVALKRGDVVANEQMVRTLATGHVELQRNLEIVTLGANTEIRISTDAETGYTTVLQDFGRVEVDAEAKRIKHFEVKTPYLAAVVKGTHFIVTSDTEGAWVQVDRGAVQVQSVSSERMTTIRVGQTATVKRKTDLVIGGIGPWPAILEPGVTRATIVASLGKGFAPVSNADPELVELRSSIAPPVQTSRPTGGVQSVTQTAALFGFAATQTTSAASNEPAQPVSLGIVLIGAVLGAVLGGLALLFRRAI